MRPQSRNDGEDGFAAIDALVALMILASTISLSLVAAGIAHRAAAAAVETRRADQMLKGLLESAPRQLGSVSGRLAGFDCRVETRGAGAEANIRLCDRLAGVRSVTSGRRYRLATTEICPPQEASTETPPEKPQATPS